MKKMEPNFNQKDRVVCVTVQGAHEFYYQPAGSKERIPGMVEYVIHERFEPKRTYKHDIAVCERMVCHPHHEGRGLAA